MAKFLEVDFSDFSHVGHRRKNNEDYASFFVPENEEDRTKNGSLFTVADGVGGTAKGEVASKFAAETVIYEYYQNPGLPPKERLLNAFQKANKEIHLYAEENGHYTKMATTLIAAVVIQNQLIVANVGDSRAYLIHKGEVCQISRDHSIVAEMVRDGSMSEEEASRSKIKNRLSRSIGGEAEVAVDIFPPIAIQEGDRILLCSDGLTRYASPGDILTLSSSGSVEEATQQLIKFANKCGGADNTTVILLDTVTKSKTNKRAPTRIDKIPQLPEWQTAATQYPQPILINKKKKSLFPYIFSFISLSVVAFLFLDPFNLVNPKPLIKPNQKNTITPQSIFEGVVETQTDSFLIPNIITSLIPIIKTQPPQQQADLPLIKDSTQAIISPTPSSNKSHLATSRTPNPLNKDWECIYVIKQGDTLGNILPMFPNLTYLNDGKYYFYESCIVASGETQEYQSCDVKTKTFILNNNIIPVGKYLIVYSTKEGGGKISPEDCIKGKGRLFYTP